MFKSDIINFFQDGCKKRNQLNIGVEHEKFIFKKKTNQRVNFQTISKIFEYLKKFGWKPIKEINNIIALSRGKQNISLEPGTQVELSGAKYSSIPLVCNQSYNYLNEFPARVESVEAVGYEKKSSWSDRSNVVENIE